MIGDFNEIRNPTDRGKHEQFRANAFNLAVSGLNELDAMGGYFTWENGFRASHTKSKLD